MCKNRVKKIACFAVLSFVIFVLLLLPSCQKTEKPVKIQSSNNTGFIQIREKMFIAQVNEIYLNAADYMGKTIRLEGLYLKEESQNPNMEGRVYNYIIRYGPGCCGDDGNVGFEIAWTGDKIEYYPDAGSWIEISGKLKEYEENYKRFLYLDLDFLNVMEKTGNAYVVQ